MMGGAASSVRFDQSQILPSEPQPAPDARVRVLYIMGAGRSGSTLLDTVLASHPDVVGVGELVNLHSAGWTSNEICACGQLGTACGFWMRVRAAWQRRAPEATVEGYIALQKKFELFQWFGVKNILRLVRQQFARTADFTAYLRQTEALYHAIAEASGKSIVVDSSKSPIRGALLANLSGIDLRLIHLVRDARAVAWSRKKALEADKKAGVQTAIKSRPVWYSVGYWAFINILSMIVGILRWNKSLRMRYEDFVSQPKPQMDRLSHVVGLDYSAAVQALLNGEPIRVEHPIAGNRMRMKGNVTLKPDWEWMERLPSRDRVICWITGGWLLLAYRYGISGTRPTASRMPPQNGLRGQSSTLASLWQFIAGQPVPSAK